MKMHHKTKQILRYIYIPCIFCVLGYGVFLFAGKPVEEYMAAQIRAAMIKGNPQYGFEYEKEEVVSEGTISINEVKAPSVGEEYALLYSDVLGLKTPLYFGDSDSILDKGVGQYVKSSLPGFGGTILVGGHDSSVFAPLKDVEIGQEIELYTMYGHFVYQVEETKVADSDDIAACRLDDENEQLVLYTCYPFGEVLRARDQRFFVYCKKVSGPEVEVGKNE